MPRRRPDRFLTTVLFTDIVGSTELLASLGDRPWRDLLSRHHAEVRRRLREYGGREMDTAGDGFFARFDQPARAIACARAIADGLRAMGIEIRAGLHMGEVEVTGGKVGGIAVHIGARIAQQAGPGEVLVSATVRDLVAGSGERFRDRGGHALKGVPGAWHLYSVEWDRSPVPDPSPRAPEEAGKAGQAGQRRPWPLRPVGLATSAAAVAVAVVGLILLLPGGSTPGHGVGPSPSSRPGLPGDGVVGVMRLDPATGSLVPVPFVMSPSQVDADKRMWPGRSFIWVSDTIGDAVYKVNPATGAKVNQIGVTHVNGVAELAGVLWAAQGRPDGPVPRQVVRISPLSNEVLGDPLDIDPCCGGITAGAGSVWALSGTKLFRIDPASLRVSTIPVGGTQVAFGEGRVWVLDAVSAHYFEVDPATGRVVDDEATPHDAPSAIAAAFGALWVTDAREGMVTKISLSKDRPNLDVAVGKRPNDIAVGLDAVWTASIDGASVSRIDPVAETATTVRIGGRPTHLAVWGRFVWVVMDRLAT